MKLLLLSFAFLFSVASAAQKITIQEDQTKIYFTFPDQDVEGELSDFKFTGAIDLNTIEAAVISGSAATETLDTDNWFRDRHLRSKKYFSAKAHPLLYFKSNRIASTNSGFRVSGQLTIKGITQNCIWNFTIQENNLIGTAHINTHDYNIKVYDEQSRNNVSIKIVLPYTK
ncbi:YceI family protein [uncultured Dokdonia sp.]|uniref:YceI family protein n=1 Tax=uncultured Dokdonia sp. TaxID=575653 RepID=UPI002638FBC6|nr:YceI family protein [uncultured Dokdonia sp.]